MLFWLTSDRSGGIRHRIPNPLAIHTSAEEGKTTSSDKQSWSHTGSHFFDVCNRPGRNVLNRVIEKWRKRPFCRSFVAWISRDTTLRYESTVCPTMFNVQVQLRALKDDCEVILISFSFFFYFEPDYQRNSFDGGLYDMKNLKWLSVNRSNISTLPEDLEKFPKLVSVLKCLWYTHPHRVDYCKFTLASRQTIWYTSSSA